MFRIITLLFFTFIFLHLKGMNDKESSIIHRVNLKFSHSSTPSFLEWDENISTGNYRIEGNYGFFNTLEGGAYMGYDRFWNSKEPTNNPDNPSPFSQTSRFQSDALFFGINTNYHIMPYLVDGKNVRVDFYFSGKLGAISMFAPESSIYKGTELDFGVYIGFAYFIKKSWGLYIEYGRNKKVNLEGMESCLRYGLTINI